MNKNLKTKLFSVLVIVFSPYFIFAKTVEKVPFSWTKWIFDNIFVVIGLALLLGVMGALWKLVDSMRELTRQTQMGLLKAQGLEVSEEFKSTKRPSFLRSLYDKAWSLVPVEKEADIDLGHDYDGIRELDNRLPPWWLWLFYFTIAFAIGYIYIYHVSGIGMNQKEEYEYAMKKGEEQKIAYLASQKSAVDENTVTALEDETALESGKKVYQTNCVACHGAQGEGGVGPNLTDEYWLHGGGIKNVFKTIKYGVPEKGMISWQSQLQPETIQKVASFILTLQGTNPPNGKAPQGEIWKSEK